VAAGRAVEVGRLAAGFARRLEHQVGGAGPHCRAAARYVGFDLGRGGVSQGACRLKRGRETESRGEGFRAELQARRGRTAAVCGPSDLSLGFVCVRVVATEAYSVLQGRNNTAQ
jgi:hypothetical protein